MWPPAAMPSDGKCLPTDRKSLSDCLNYDYHISIAVAEIKDERDFMPCALPSS